MGGFIKGEVVAVLFPFSDFSEAKRRPALVLASVTGGDVILCQITTVEKSDGYSIPLSSRDFAKGRLQKDCSIRPNHLFTADPGIIKAVVGKVNPTKLKEVVDAVIKIIQV